MGEYKGNVGNLMQHWTLCEVLQAAQEHTDGLSFIDAHAMAPLANARTCKNAYQKAVFNSVRDDLPGQGSVYEQAWHRLAPTQRDVYPNSATFVRVVWKGDYSMLLCELDPGTADEIDSWLPSVRKSPKCKEASLFRGDWRTRFEKGLPGPNTAGLPDGSLTLVSFDPCICSRNSPPSQPAGNLYPKDLELAVRALNDVRGGVLMQLSTYSANGDNPQREVITSVKSVLRCGRFTLAAVVKVNGNMMSMVYARDVGWAADLAALPGRFNEWRWSKNIPKAG